MEELAEGITYQAALLCLPRKVFTVASTRRDYLGGGRRQPDHELEGLKLKVRPWQVVWGSRVFLAPWKAWGESPRSQRGLQSAGRGLNSSSSGGHLGTDKWAVHR